jgi:U3 small nucleolar RNA-associated protein 21
LKTWPERHTCLRPGRCQSNARWACPIRVLPSPWNGRWIVAASMDSVVRVWDMPTGHLIDIFRVSSTCVARATHVLETRKMSIKCPVGMSHTRTTESMEAATSDDLSIRVIDLETRKLVREFWGCVGQVNDFIFSNDSRSITRIERSSQLKATNSLALL